MGLIRKQESQPLVSQMELFQFQAESNVQKWQFNVLNVRIPPSVRGALRSHGEFSIPTARYKRCSVSKRYSCSYRLSASLFQNRKLCLQSLTGQIKKHLCNCNSSKHTRWKESHIVNKQELSLYSQVVSKRKPQVR